MFASFSRFCPTFHYELLILIRQQIRTRTFLSKGWLEFFHQAFGRKFQTCEGWLEWKFYHFDLSITTHHKFKKDLVIFTCLDDQSHVSPLLQVIFHHRRNRKFYVFRWLLFPRISNFDPCISLGVVLCNFQQMFSVFTKIRIHTNTSFWIQTLFFPSRSQSKAWKISRKV